MHFVYIINCPDDKDTTITFKAQIEKTLGFSIFKGHFKPLHTGLLYFQILVVHRPAWCGTCMQHCSAKVTGSFLLDVCGKKKRRANRRC